jgi:hypothetical protein
VDKVAVAPVVVAAELEVPVVDLLISNQVRNDNIIVLLLDILQILIQRPM